MMETLRLKLDEDLIKSLYLHKMYSAEMLTEYFGVSRPTIANRLKSLGIKRSRKEVAKVEWSQGRPKSRLGENNHSWRGGKFQDTNGYIYIYKPDHKRADKRRYVQEHILVWEETHQRELPRGWVIHHLNGIKGDNRPNNLKALPNKKHNILIVEFQKHIRELEIENKQLKKALENSQSIFYISEN